MSDRHYPECDSYVCDGCPRWGKCDAAEPIASRWPPRPPASSVAPPALRAGSRMRLVYIAGALSGREVEYLANVARMAQVWRKLIEAGYACFCPAADLLLGLVTPAGWPGSVYKEQSMEMLRRCDVVFVTNPAEISWGVAAEIAEAERLGIPVAYRVEDLGKARGHE